MSEEVFIRHCSPTLAGMKAGNMFSSNFESFEQLKAYVDELNEMLNPKGMQVIILRYKDGFSLIGVFRIKAIKAILQDYCSITFTSNFIHINYFIY